LFSSAGVVKPEQKDFHSRDAWWNRLDNGIFGEEIGDECSFLFIYRS
jgi:hypothetical protein